MFHSLVKATIMDLQLINDAHPLPLKCFFLMIINPYKHRKKLKYIEIEVLTIIT